MEIPESQCQETGFKHSVYDFNYFSLLSWSIVSVAMRIYYCFQLSSALKKVHSKGILHRDLKPQNLLFSRKGDLLLADFGGTKD